MGRKIKLDMTNISAYQRCEEGRHRVKVVSVEEATSQGGNDMLKVAFEVISGSSKGARVFENFALTDKALWKLKLCLKSMGMKADGKISLDLDRLVGKTTTIEVGYEEYNGQDRARILNYFETNSTPEQNDDDDDDDDEDETEVDNEDNTEVEEEVVEEKPKKTKPIPSKPSKKPSKPSQKKKPDPEPEEDDWDDDDEDWEEE